MTANSKLSDVLAHIDAQRESFLHRLIDYVRHPSISAHNIGIREVAGPSGRHAHRARPRHAAGADRRASDGGGALARRRRARRRCCSTVTTTCSRPIRSTCGSARRSSRRSATAASTRAASATTRASISRRSWRSSRSSKVHGRLPCNVILLLEGEEEIGSPHIADFVREHRDLLKADLVVTADGPVHAIGPADDQVRLARRRQLRAARAARQPRRPLRQLRRRGAEPALDAGAPARHDEERARRDHHRRASTTTSCRRRREELEAAARLPLDLEEVKRSLGLDRLDAPPERDYFERLCFRPTLTINGLHGGYGGPGSKTVLPHEAVAKCDIRLVEAQDTADILARSRRMCASTRPRSKFVAQGSGMQPSKTPITSPHRGADPPGDRRGAGRRAAALSGRLRQPARLRLHQDPRHRRVRDALRQCRRGQPRAEREPEARLLLQRHPHRRGAAGQVGPGEGRLDGAIRPR